MDLLAPLITSAGALTAALRRDGHAVLDARGLCELVPCEPADLDALRGSWNHLPPDAYLRDGGRYRRRRHACFVADAGRLAAAPHRPHWQPVEYNALHGGLERWFVEAHQFRIDTTDGIGRPTPEGAHRDGVDFVAVVLVDRVDVKGAETRVFEADGPAGLRFTLTERWSTLLLDDGRVIHESTPIQPLAADGHRDTLVLTFRAGGFQGPAG